MIRGFFYRLLMRVAHRFDWHYAPVIGPFEDGSRQYWCKWCGLRETVPPPDPVVSYMFGYSSYIRGPLITNLQIPKQD